MTYSEAVERLKLAGIDDAGYEVGLMLENYCGIRRYEINLFRDRDYSDVGFLEAVERRAKREPLQYIFGSWFFYGREFVLNSSTLIPRPDTEITVETAIRRLPSGARFCDIGTGSGAIAMSVLAERPDTSAVATDISPEALKTASHNAVRLGVSDRLETVLNDILNDSEALREAYSGFDAVISNPPYIKTAEIRTLEPELAYEPVAALDGGADGLVFYRSIIDACRGILLKDNGLLIFEAGFGEAGDILEYGRANGFDGTVFRDLSGIERTVLLEKKNAGNRKD